MGPAAGAVLGDLGGSLISGMFGASQARKQMKFQEHMAGTQYRRAAFDLQHAGLNRVLALGNPAAAPSGAAASIEAPKLGTSATNAKVAASQVEVQQQQARLLSEQASKTAAERENVIAQTRNTEADTILKGIMGPFYQSSTGLNVANTGKVSSEIDLLKGQLNKIVQDTKTAVEETRLKGSEADMNDVKRAAWRAAEPIVNKLLNLLGPKVNQFLDSASGKDSSGAGLLAPLKGNEIFERMLK